MLERVATTMKTRGFGYAFNVVAVAVLLAGCGGSSTPTLTPRVATTQSPRLGGIEKVIYSFAGGSDGIFPDAPLIVDRGTLYGTTRQGGGACGDPGCGTVFRSFTTGGESKLYSFKGRPDGMFPSGRLTARNGRWYGVTVIGGKHKEGVIFSVAGSGKERVLHSFRGPDGWTPNGRLVPVNGIFYGTTVYGGEHNMGAVFAVTPTGRERVLYSFGGTDGANPIGGLTAVGGALYGVTDDGGTYNLGTIFEITSSGKEHVLHSFNYGTDGQYPDAELLAVGGELYGTTAAGGTNYLGTVFAVSTSGKERIVHSFRGSPDDGASPISALIDLDGTLYGTTRTGGGKGDGVVFGVTPTGKERVLHSFGGKPDGMFPAAGLVEWIGTLYGVTTEGGTGSCWSSGGGCGAIFAVTPK